MDRASLRCTDQCAAVHRPHPCLACRTGIFPKEIHDPIEALAGATDLSAPARHAAERAAWVARDTGATLDLVHVVPLSPLQHLRRLAVPLPPELPQQLLDEADAALQALAAALQQQHGVGAGMHVAAGPLLDEIGRFVAASSASLVV